MEKLEKKISYEVSLDLNQAVGGILSMASVLDRMYNSAPVRKKDTPRPIVMYPSRIEPLVDEKDYALALSN